MSFSIKLGNFLYNNAIPLVMQDRTVVSEEDLKNIWELSQDDIVAAGFDHTT
jgi:hypothetical protein